MMTELDLMLAGELYDPSDPVLVAMRHQARQLTSEYNRTASTDAAGRQSLLETLLGQSGVGLDLQPPFFCDYGAHIEVGANVFMNFNCIILDCAKVVLGDQVMMGPNVQLYTATHPLDAAARCSGRELAAPIHIGRRVWLGGGAIVCPGVSIGEDSTIGAGSVVTKDIPARVFAAGNPCRVIRHL
jgi:maltose O-acetyltransferase